MPTPLLDKALTQRTEITAQHISRSKYQSKVTKLKAAIAQNQNIGEILQEELDRILQNYTIPKNQSKKAERMQKLKMYFNSKSKK